MRAEVLNAFLQSAIRTLSIEAKSPVHRVGLQLEASDRTSDEVNVHVSIVGQVKGVMLVGLPMTTARQVASMMIGEPQPTLSEIGLSALAELGNLVAGGATTGLSELGLSCDITPPTLMIGQQTRISTLGLPRFIIPLHTEHGDLHLHVAVAEPEF